MSSNATFDTDQNVPLDEFREGIAYYWPSRQRDRKEPPIRGRLMRIRSPRHKTDLWLFTNAPDPQPLSGEMAGLYYRLRWEDKGFFRTYKRTLKKMTLMSRSLRLVHRGAEASMIATQLLLCRGAMAMHPGAGCPKIVELHLGVKLDRKMTSLVRTARVR